MSRTAKNSPEQPSGVHKAKIGVRHYETIEHLASLSGVPVSAAAGLIAHVGTKLLHRNEWSAGAGIDPCKALWEIFKRSYRRSGGLIDVAMTESVEEIVLNGAKHLRLPVPDYLGALLELGISVIQNPAITELLIDERRRENTVFQSYAFEVATEKDIAPPRAFLKFEAVLCSENKEGGAE